MSASQFKKIFLLIVLVLVTYFGIQYWKEETSPETGLTEIRVAQTGDFLIYAGLYLAQGGGFFENNGLSVSITNTGGDEKSVAAILSKQADLGVGDPTFAAIANQRGQDVKVIAGLVNGAPFWGITYDEQTVNDYKSSGLSNLKVATFPAPSTAYVLQENMFRSEGLEPNIVEGAFGSLAGILERGGAQIALELEPNVSTAQERGATVLYSLAERYGDFAITGITVTAEYAVENSESLSAFCQALAEAYRFAREDIDGATRILVEKFPELEEKVVRNAVLRMAAENIIPETPVISEAAWRKAIELRVKAGDIEDAERAMKVLDNQFVGN